jgi:acetyltransferase
VLQIYGTVLPENAGMLKLAERLGFLQKLNSRDGVMEIAKELNPLRHGWQRKRIYPM